MEPVGESETGLDITTEAKVQTTAFFTCTLLCPLVVSLVVLLNGVDR